MARPLTLDRLATPDRYPTARNAWVASIPGTVLIGEAPLRTRVRLAGEMRRMIDPRFEFAPPGPP